MNWFAPPFAARYVRVVPKTYTGAVCMRMDLIGCKNCKYNLLEAEFLNFDQERIKGTERASPIHTLFHR